MKSFVEAQEVLAKQTKKAETKATKPVAIPFHSIVKK